MPRSLWEELGGYDEAFETPGGGFVNSDTLTRAVSLTNTTIITLLGEGTFHQVHGGGDQFTGQHERGLSFRIRAPPRAAIPNTSL